MKYAFLENWQAYDRPMQVTFFGSQVAEDFTREIADSLAGVLQYNFRYDEENVGFVTASIEGRAFSDVMWTRDAGVFLRELVCYGYLGHAVLLTERLISLSCHNQAGFYAFPRLLHQRCPEAGDEVDGTSAILIGMAMLYRKLLALQDEAAKAYAERLLRYATAPDSSLRYLLLIVNKQGLVAGSGEFGGGMGTDGLWLNVVQNALVRDAFRIWAEILQVKDSSLSLACKDAADTMEQEILRVFSHDDGLYFCLDLERKPNLEVLSSFNNDGFTGVNGVLSMACDADGFSLEGWPLLEQARRTFFSLLNRPYRRELFDRYGIYVQFKNIAQGFLTSPSYGQGYALQSALLLDEMEIAGKLVEYLVTATKSPPREYDLTRTEEHQYWFYERLLAPDYFKLPHDQQNCGEGCGALNLVNVAEPMKCARLITGFAGDGAERCGKVRLPKGFTGFRIENAGVIESGRMIWKTLEG